PLGVDRLGIFTATGSPLDAEGDSVFTGEIVATPIPGPAAVLHLFTVLVAIAIWYEAGRRAAKKAGLNRTIRFKLYRLLRRAKRIKGRSTLRTASTCAPLIIGMLNLVPMARADTIQFILNNGVLSVDYTGSRVESLEGCCGGIFEGPGPGINATSGGMGGDLFGDAGDPSLVVFIGTLYNAADPTTPALIEVEVRETDISPDICHDVLGCVQTQDGVNVDFDNIYWSDGTMNTINFLSVVS